MKNVSKCMTMFYFHTFWTIRAFHFSYQRLRYLKLSDYATDK